MIKHHQPYWAAAIVLFSSVGVFLAPSAAYADKVSDFKAAASNIDVEEKGCYTIPYSDLQSSCLDQRSNVHSWCDGGRGPITCEANASSNLIKSLVTEERNYDTLKRKESELKDAIGSATNDQAKADLKKSLETTEQDIYKSYQARNNIKTAIDQREDLVDGAIYNIGKCIDYRRAVQNAFSSALDRMRNENESAIQPEATKLRVWYEQGKSGHETAITHKENALANCKKEEL